MMKPLTVNKLKLTSSHAQMRRKLTCQIPAVQSDTFDLYDQKLQLHQSQDEIPFDLYIYNVLQDDLNYIYLHFLFTNVIFVFVICQRKVRKVNHLAAPFLLHFIRTSLQLCCETRLASLAELHVGELVICIRCASAANPRWFTLGGCAQTLYV